MPATQTELRTYAAHVPAGNARLLAEVAIPADPVGGVMFVYGGSPHARSRKRYVAAELNMFRLATVLVDLLTPDEERSGQTGSDPRLDVSLLTERVVSMIDWVHTFQPMEPKPLGLFGASTGAAAALEASTRRPHDVRAIVCRGGRPDLTPHLDEVRAPTLLIVGGEDYEVLDVNSEVLARLHCRRRLEVVTGAGHLFHEPGALERVAGLAGAWFHEHF